MLLLAKYQNKTTADLSSNSKVFYSAFLLSSNNRAVLDSIQNYHNVQFKMLLRISFLKNLGLPSQTSNFISYCLLKQYLVLDQLRKLMATFF